ncbi:MAG: class I SAM-dependent methyltransferase, partial [Coriobacteriales bacterium]|nr:class I SAM-dependent methyltransferase [Coriobacteriales bacterium]
RAQVSTHNPDVTVVTRISRNRALVGIDLAGTPLFKRAYGRSRIKGGLRSDYAAALLQLGGWGDATRQTDPGVAPSLLVVSPNPDSLAVEAALMAAHHAPGLSRTTWGFKGWAGHDEDAWQQVLAEAREKRRTEACASIRAVSWEVSALQTRATLDALGIKVPFEFVSAKELALEDPAKGGSSSPANGTTLAAFDLSGVSSQELAREASLLSSMTSMVRTTQPRSIAVAARDSLSGAYLQQEPQHKLASMLGRDELLLLAFNNQQDVPEPHVVELPNGKNVPVLMPQSDQFVARLRKNARLLGKWAKKEDITCYRIYDADLPDYAVSLEVYQGTNPATGEPTKRKWLQIFEYAPPKSIDPLVAQSRLMDVLSLAPKVLDIEDRNVFVHVRKRDKGGSQYASEATGVFAKPVSKGHVPLPPGAHLIDEGGLTFEVNFSSRLDCGIFLDHRDTRAMLREMAKQTKGSKRFLNLFAYTGTATCYAADGGMRYTTTVDLSRPSLDWARRNMLRNGFDGAEHEYVQADVIRWISEQRRTKNRWDLVFCDVPTFSNSNRMGRRSFDVQRDHAELLIGVSRLLVRGGVCVFSCNLRSFKPDVEALGKAGVTIEDITGQTIPHDFERNARIHHAYLVRRP